MDIVLNLKEAGMQHVASSAAKARSKRDACDSEQVKAGAVSQTETTASVSQTETGSQSRQTFHVCDSEQVCLDVSQTRLHSDPPSGANHTMVQTPA